MPQVVDELAAIVPNRVYAAIPKTADVQDGYQDVTIAELAGSVNFMARWLEKRFGRSETFETITYVGLSDLKGITILLAAIKVGYKVRYHIVKILYFHTDLHGQMLVPSPRNPPAINLHLMNATASSKVLYATELEPLMKPLQAMAPSTEFQAVPPFQEMLDGDGNTTPYPYVKTFEEARNDPIVVLHSSGSTGKAERP